MGIEKIFVFLMPWSFKNASSYTPSFVYILSLLWCAAQKTMKTKTSQIWAMCSKWVVQCKQKSALWMLTQPS